MWLSWLTCALLLGTLCAGKERKSWPLLLLFVLWVKGLQVATLQPANSASTQTPKYLQNTPEYQQNTTEAPVRLASAAGVFCMERAVIVAFCEQLHVKPEEMCCECSQ